MCQKKWPAGGTGSESVSQSRDEGGPGGGLVEVMCCEETTTELLERSNTAKGLLVSIHMLEEFLRKEIWPLDWKWKAPEEAAERSWKIVEGVARQAA